MSAPAPQLPVREAASIEVDLDGRVLDAASLLSLETWDELGRRPRARLTVRYDVEDAGWVAEEEGLLGGTLRIALGYGGTMARVHEGTLGRITVRIEPRRSGKDPMHVIAKSRGGAPLAAAEVHGAPEPVLELTYGDSIIEIEASRASAGGGVTGRVRCQGSVLATPGAFIRLGNVHRLIDGDVRVRGVRHMVRDGNWLTDFTFGEGNPDAVG